MKPFLPLHRNRTSSERKNEAFTNYYPTVWSMHDTEYNQFDQWFLFSHVQIKRHLDYYSLQFFQ